MVDDHLQRVALAIITVFPALSTIVLALRLYSRKSLTKHLGPDDYLVIGAWVLVIPETYTTWMYITTNHIGLHVKDIKSTNTVLGQKFNYANQMLYNPILSLIKLSVIIFMLRLNSRQKPIRIFAWAVFAVTLLLMILILFIDVFQCSPVAYVYDTSIVGGKCINQGAFFVATACLTLFTDVLVLALPAWITLTLQMKLRQKVAVISLLSLGLAVTAVGIYRVVILTNAYFPTSVNTDPTYNIGFCTSAVEVNVAIITACGPALKPLITHYLPSLLGGASSKGYNRTAYYGRGTSGYGTGTQVTIRGGKSMAFEMGTMKTKRTAETDSADNDSEKGIMTYDGIMRSVDVSVSYVGAPAEQEESGAAYPIQEPQPDSRNPDQEREFHRERKMSTERIV